MNLILNYAIVYEYPASYSHILKLAKAEIASNAIEHTRSKRMADYLIKEMELLESTAKTTAQLGSVNVGSDIEVDRQIEQIHLKTKEKREQRYLEPMYSAEEMEQEFLEDFARQYPEAKELIDVIRNKNPRENKEVKLSL